ncbi:MAG: hypothetical protein LBR77_10045 [Lachnospiraceae bacterium]|jgi:xylulokinase|nr:hypothetical protein [Lachnospiraceae bacterium]
MKYIIAHDFGTSAAKSALITTDGQLVKTATAEYPTYREKEGWVEQDPEDWWKVFCANNRILTEGIDKNDILCVCNDGTTSDTVLIGEDGKPLRNAIIWMDNRAIKEGKEITAMLTPEMAEGRRFIGPGRSGVSLYWIKKNLPDVFAKAKHWIPNNHNYIIYKLTGKNVTDRIVAWSGALVDTDRKDWTWALIDQMGIPKHLIPEMHDMADVAGEILESVADEAGLAPGTKVVIGTADGDINRYGSGIIHKGDTSISCGTSGGVSCVGSPVSFPGTSNSGNTLEWLRKTICIEEDKQAAATGESVFTIMLDQNAAQAPLGSNGVIFCPYLAGERGIRTNNKAKAFFTGVSLKTTHNDLIRAVIEGVGYNLNEILVKHRAAGMDIKAVTAMGGMSKSPFVRQVFADILNAEVYTIKNAGWAAVIGNAVLACVAMGIYKDVDEGVSVMVQKDTATKPIPENAEKYAKYFHVFEEAYQSQVAVFDELWELGA